MDILVMDLSIIVPVYNAIPLWSVVWILSFIKLRNILMR